MQGQDYGLRGKELGVVDWLTPLFASYAQSVCVGASRHICASGVTLRSFFSYVIPTDRSYLSMHDWNLDVAIAAAVGDLQWEVAKLAERKQQQLQQQERAGKHQEQRERENNKRRTIRGDRNKRRTIRGPMEPQKKGCTQNSDNKGKQDACGYTALATTDSEYGLGLGQAESQFRIFGCASFSFTSKLRQIVFGV